MPDRIMLGEGNPLWMPFDRLKQIFEMIERYLPGYSTICGDASILAISRKSDSELAWLADHGYRMAYVGIESGLDDVLAFMDKDHNNTEAREQIARLHDAGIDFGAHIMTDVAGAGRGLENARATAELLNELEPAHICDFTTFVGSVTELGLKEEDGLFVQASILENLQEMRELLGGLDPARCKAFFEGYVTAYLLKPEGKGAGPRTRAFETASGTFLRKNLLLKGDLREEREHIMSELDGHIQTAIRFEEAYESRRRQAS